MSVLLVIGDLTATFKMKNSDKSVVPLPYGYFLVLREILSRVHLPHIRSIFFQLIVCYIVYFRDHQFDKPSRLRGKKKR